MRLGGREIKLAIFDLDGTLLDSTSLWADIDRDFFGRRNMRVPEFYGETIVHMGLQRGAEMTRDTYFPNETVEGILQEWRDASLEAYENRLELKFYAKDLLDAFAARDIPIALATANSRDLYLPCLKRLQIDHYFEQIADVDTAKEGKSSRRIYDMLAQHFGVDQENVVIFEDALEALKTAHDAGYLTIGVHDPNTTKPESEKHCDYVLKSFLDFVYNIDEANPLPLIEEGDFVLRRYGFGYEIVSYKGAKEGDLHIPSMLRGRKVLRIDRMAFADNLFSGIEFEEGLEEIGTNAFRFSERLSTLTLPASIRLLDYGAFAVSSFHRLEILGPIERINGAFAGCGKLTEIVLPSNFTHVPEDSFHYLDTLETLVLPEGVVFIDGGAFNGAISLKSITLPHSLSFIGEKAFYGCPNLTEVHYEGNREEKDKITIRTFGNEFLFEANWTFRS